jgi:hypothetical protein
MLNIGKEIKIGLESNDLIIKIISNNKKKLKKYLKLVKK